MGFFFPWDEGCACRYVAVRAYRCVQRVPTHVSAPARPAHISAPARSAHISAPARPAHISALMCAGLAGALMCADLAGALMCAGLAGALTCVGTLCTHLYARTATYLHAHPSSQGKKKPTDSHRHYI